MGSYSSPSLPSRLRGGVILLTAVNWHESMDKTVIRHPQLGEITVRRSTRARRLSVSVRPSGVTLTLPPRFPLREALAFAESKTSWIERARKRATDRIKPPSILLPPFQTRAHTLVLSRGTKFEGWVRDGIISITLPPGENPESQTVQAWIKKAVRQAYRMEAQRFLPERIAALAGRHGFSYRKVTFRDTVSRWGSCSADNSISLSIHLMTLPDELIDYILLHELCHTVHKNHGPEFHELLDRVTHGRDRELNRRLQKYTPRW